MASYISTRGSSCKIPKCSTSKIKHPSSALPLQNCNDVSLSQLCEAVQRNVQQIFMDKSQKMMIGAMKHMEHHLVKELNEYHDELNRKSLQESEKNLSEVFSVAYLMQDLRNELTLGNLKDIDVDQFQIKLLDLEDKIATLKEKFRKRLIMLKQEEKKLEAQVKVMANKVDEWSKPIKFERVIPSVHHTAALFNSGFTYNESVNCFQKFLQERGGHTGGWSEADHLHFIRLRRKHPRKQTLYTHLHEDFPDKSLEELREHDQWFTEYQDLKAKQREAIAEWRANKKPSLHRTASDCNLVPSLQLPKAQLKEDNYAATDCSGKRERQKQELEKWRNMKSLELKLKDLKMKDELCKQEMQEEMKRMRQAAQKAEVERYKEKKLNDEHAAMLEKQALENALAEERACNANRTLKIFRQRDAEILARQREMKDHLQQVQEHKQKVLEALQKKVRVDVARDPHRLLRPTGAWREHTKAAKSMDSLLIQSSIPLNVQEVPHLGIPAWRRNQK